MTAIRTKATHSQNGVTGATGLQPPHSLERLAVPETARRANRSLAQARAVRVGRPSAGDFLRFAVVAIYLACVMGWLLVSRQIRPNFSVRRTLRSLVVRRSRPTPRPGVEEVRA